MKGDRVFILRNRQKVVGIDTRTFRRIALSIIRHNLQIARFELGCHLVEAQKMECINMTYLQHQGSTDVITFDHSDNGCLKHVLTDEKPVSHLHGEIYICINEALSQAKSFGTTWQSELIRYFIHGLLHLLGHNDVAEVCRKQMKREEDKLLREVHRSYSVSKLAAHGRSLPRRAKP